MTDSVAHLATGEGGGPSQEPPNGGNDGINEEDEQQQLARGKEAKAEPLTILVRDQTGAGLQFKVRKNTKFEKVRHS